MSLMSRSTRIIRRAAIPCTACFLMNRLIKSNGMADICRRLSIQASNKGASINHQWIGTANDVSPKTDAHMHICDQHAQVCVPDR